MKINMNNPEDLDAYLQRLMKNPANRSAYYASRAWHMRKQAVAIRCNGKCERCGRGKFEIAHHLTYAHFGAEYIKELQGLCRQCHAYLHARSEYDPCKDDGRTKQLSLEFN